MFLLLQENHSSQVNNNEQAELVNTRLTQRTTKKFSVPPNCQQNKRKHEDMIEESYNVIKRLSCSVRDKDEFDIFGKHVACSIRNLDSDFLKSTVKHCISNILYQAEIGELHPQNLINSEISAWPTFANPNIVSHDKNDEIK